MHICFTIVDLCYLNFCVSLPQWELCYLCQYAVCAVSILTAGLHANASANEQQCEQQANQQQPSHSQWEGLSSPMGRAQFAYSQSEYRSCQLNIDRIGVMLKRYDMRDDFFSFIQALSCVCVVTYQTTVLTFNLYQLYLLYTLLIYFTSTFVL